MCSDGARLVWRVFLCTIHSSLFPLQGGSAMEDGVPKDGTATMMNIEMNNEQQAKAEKGAKKGGKKGGGGGGAKAAANAVGAAKKIAAMGAKKKK